MARQKSIRANFMQILRKAMEEKFTGRLIFMGRDGGVVRVTLIDGAIKQIDSTWGFGKSELEKLKIWGSGLCLIKGLTSEEKERFSKMSTIHLDEERRTGPSPVREVEVPRKATRMLPYRVLDGGPTVLDEILEEIQREEKSGYLKVKPQDALLLFYRGRILGAFENLPPSEEMKLYEMIRLLHDSSNQILFYALREDHARAFITLFYHRLLFSGTAGGEIDPDEYMEQLEKEGFVGVMWINSSYRTLVYFENGKVAFAARINDVWRFTTLPRAQDLPDARFWVMESLPDEEILSMSTVIIDEGDFDRLMMSWLKFNRSLIEKVGKKMAQRVAEKILQDPEMAQYFTIKNGMITPLSDARISRYALMEYILEITSRLLKEFSGIIGGNWLENRLKEFYRQESELLESTGLAERMKKLWISSR